MDFDEVIKIILCILLLVLVAIFGFSTLNSTYDDYDSVSCCCCK